MFHRNFFSLALFAAILSLSVGGCSVLPKGKISLLGDSEKSEEREIAKIIESVDTSSVEQTLYKSAQEAENNGELTKSGYYYEQLYSRYPENPIYTYKYAEVLRKMGNCKTARNMYDNLLKSNPDNIDYQESKALCLLAEAKFQEAGDIFTRIIQTDANRWKSINGAGLIFAANNKYQEANQYFDLAAKVSNRNPAVLNNQALLKALIGNTNDAIGILKDASIRSMSDSGQNRAVKLNLALVYAIAGKIEMAERTAKPVLTEPQLYNNMGVYAQLAKDNDLAKTYLNKALMGTSVYYDKAWENLENLQKGR